MNDWEPGRALIDTTASQIIAQSVPSPVGFDHTLCKDVKTDDDVIFRRSSFNPTWATDVVLAGASHGLVSLAMTQGQFTRAAAFALRNYAIGLISEAATAPSDALRNEHLALAQAHMTALGKHASEGDRPLGVKGLRSFIEAGA